jgi:hypothetical protein
MVNVDDCNNGMRARTLKLKFGHDAVRIPNARLSAWRDCVANRAFAFTRIANEERPALRLASCFHRRSCGGTFAGSALLVAGAYFALV